MMTIAIIAGVALGEIAMIVLMLCLCKSAAMADAELARLAAEERTHG
jgi:hypothetical protein